MDVNALPPYDLTDNPTGCCPQFHPEGWDHQDLHFQSKPFVRAKTHSVFHIPIDMGPVFEKVSKAIDDAHGFVSDNVIILSRDLSPWTAEHLFAVSASVPGEEMVELTGDYLTVVFEGAYRNAPKWEKELAKEVEQRGKQLKRAYFFYTTCPKCAKAYGKNYVVGVAQVE
ncbi:MAG: hypothetical protein PVI23_00420 [Maricaulaceae bacterium]|jgi:hypothetical protein